VARSSRQFISGGLTYPTLICALLTACGSGSSGDKTPTAPAVSVAAVQVSLPAQALYVGATIQATVLVKDQNGNAMSGQGVAWSTSDGTKATVSSSGLVTGVGAGTVTISATVASRQGTASLTIALVPVSSVTVAPASNELYLGQTRQFAAVVLDSAGGILTDRIVTWTSSDGTTIAISATGLATAIGVGTATITATVTGKTGTAIASSATPTIRLAMDSTPAARMGALYAPQLRVRVTFQGAGVVQYPLEWVTPDSTDGWVFPTAAHTDSGGYAEADWISGPGLTPTVTVKGNGVTLPLHLTVVPIQTTTMGRGTTWATSDGPSHVDGFRVSLTAGTAPPNTYYAAMQFNPGYMGYQVQGDGTHNLIFTIWDGVIADTDTVVASLVSADKSASCGHFGPGPEGSFEHCLMDYPWKTGQTYIFELSMKLGVGYSDYTALVTDVSSGTQDTLATIRGIPHQGPNTQGNGGFATWTEDFGPSFPSCFQSNVHDIWVHDPAYRIGSVWSPMTRAWNGSILYGGGCQNDSFSKEGNGIRLTAGGYRVDPPLPYNTGYWVVIP